MNSNQPCIPCPLSSLSFSVSLSLLDPLYFPPSTFPSPQVIFRVVWHLWAMCWVTWAAYKWKKTPKHAAFYLHTHAHTRTECIFRCPSGCARRQFYVVGDPRLWSRCLGSDNIMTESTGVTRQEGHTRTQIDACKDTYWMSYWMAQLFVHQKTQ